MSLPFGILGSRSGGRTGVGTGDHISPTPVSMWGMTPGTSTLDSTVKAPTPQPTPALVHNPYGVVGTDAPIMPAVTPNVGWPAAMGDDKWGILSRNSSITQDLAASAQRNNQIDATMQKYQPVSSGVSYVPYNGPNAVQDARMQAGQDPNGGGAYNSYDPRNAVLNAYNQGPSAGIGGSQPSPRPQQPSQNGPYNGGAWTATGNPYSAPGTNMGQTVPMTPQIANILAGGTGGRS